jgi:hypothetical protein
LYGAYRQVVIYVYYADRGVRVHLKGVGSFKGGPESVEKASGDDRNMEKAFKNEKQTRVIWPSKHIFVSLNLMIYCTLSASMLTFQLILNILPISDKKHSFSPF